MLINALLERELLYSAEGHATGTECYIEYAEPEAEKVVLTFLIHEVVIATKRKKPNSIEDLKDIINNYSPNCSLRRAKEAQRLSMRSISEVEVVVTET